MANSLIDPSKRFQIVIKKSDGTNEAIVPDGAISENHSHPIEVTEKPVGVSGVISDHYVRMQDMIEVTMIVTEYPNELPESNIPTIAETEQARVSHADQAILTRGPNGDLRRGERVYQRLLELRDSVDLVDVLTSRLTLKNMVLSDLSVSVDNSSTSTIFQCTFKRILFADSQTVPIKVRARRPKKEESNGAAEAEVETPGKSWLDTGVNILSTLGGG